jgi:hypothetical protein
MKTRTHVALVEDAEGFFGGTLRTFPKDRK